MERRRAIRRVPTRQEPITRVRLRTGQDLHLANISNLGALVEGTPRLLPGTNVEIHIVASDGRTLVRCRVVRSFVHELEPAAIRYRSALAFERLIDVSPVGYHVPGDANVGVGLGTGYPVSVSHSRSSSTTPSPHHNLQTSA